MSAPRASILRRARWWLSGGAYRLCRRDHRRYVERGVLREEQVPGLAAVTSLGMVPGLGLAMVALYGLLIFDREGELIPGWARSVAASVCFGGVFAACHGLLPGVGFTLGIWYAGMTLAGLGVVGRARRSR